MNERYLLVAPTGMVFYEIPKDEIKNRVRSVWVVRCPCCGGIKGYYNEEKDAMDRTGICVECRHYKIMPVKKYEGYSKENVKMNILVHKYKPGRDGKLHSCIEYIND